MITTSDIREYSRLVKWSLKQHEDCQDGRFNDSKRKYLITAMLLNNKQRIFGKNVKKTHTLTIQPSDGYCVSTHAEVNVLSKWKFNYSPDTIYVCGLTRAKMFCCSKPCEPCYKLIEKFKIKRIIYSTVSNNSLIIKELKVE